MENLVVTGLIRLSVRYPPAFPNRLAQTHIQRMPTDRSITASVQTRINPLHRSGLL